MRIDGTSSLESNRLTGNSAAAPKPKVSEEAIKAETIPDDPQIIYLHQKYAQEAAVAEQVDQQAIVKARDLLNSGQLDTPDAIRRAAQTIAQQGI